MNKEDIIHAIDTVGVNEVAKNMAANSWTLAQVEHIIQKHEKQADLVAAFKNIGMQHIIHINKSEKAIDTWRFKKNKKVYSLAGLYRDGVLAALQNLGFFKMLDRERNVIFIRDLNNVIEEFAPQDIKITFFEECIDKITEPLLFESLKFTPQDLREKYLSQFHLLFNDGWLQHLPTHNKVVLRDTKDEAFFPFENVVVQITSKSQKIVNYSDLNGRCVWRKHIIRRPYLGHVEYSRSHFFKFISNVANRENDRVVAMMSGMGYLLHNFNRPTGGQVVVLYDESPSVKGKPMGGTGKGLFVNAAKQMRETAKIDGKKYKSDDKFKWQNVTPSTQIVWIDDVHEKFPFSDLHSNSTDGWNIERKHKPEFSLSPNESPKTIIASNSVLTNEGSTNKRRQFILEFSDHYSKHIINGNEEPIRTEHGCTFFDDDDWNEQDWNMFFSFMIACVRQYLKKGLQVYEPKNLVRNQMLQNTNEDFTEWVFSRTWEMAIPYSPSDLFAEYKDEYLGADSQFKQQTFTNWLRYFGSCNNWEVIRKKSGNERPIVFSHKGR